MRVAMLTPLPPARTGIAHYASMILPELRKRLDIAAFDALDDYKASEFDVAVYQLGNNPHHEAIYREAMRNPGIAVLHDIVLHHLIVEMTLARGDAAGYIEELRASHGEAGAAWAEGRANGFHAEVANFLFPASIALANRSRSVIVHNEHAAQRLRSLGVEVPVHVITHPYEVSRLTPEAMLAARTEIRSRHGIPLDARVIGLFGFLTSAKRSDVTLEAFRAARAIDSNLWFLVVGEPAPNIDPASMQGDGVVFTGYVSDDEFASHYAAVDRLVNLRFPTAGESSGTLMHAFAAGRPVAVSRYAQFAEFPESCVTSIPLGDGEREALIHYFLDDLDEAAIASAQKEWLERFATVEKAAGRYAEVIAASMSTATRTPPQPRPALPLFPMLEVVARVDGDVTLRNLGTGVIQTRTYGSPGYRVLAKLFAGETEVADRWIQLPCDLAPGATTTVSVPFERGRSLRLYHAIEGVPMLEPEAWYAASL